MKISESITNLPRWKNAQVVLAQVIFRKSWWGRGNILVGVEINILAWYQYLLMRLFFFDHDKAHDTYGYGFAHVPLCTWYSGLTMVS